MLTQIRRLPAFCQFRIALSFRGLAENLHLPDGKGFRIPVLSSDKIDELADLIIVSLKH